MISPFAGFTIVVVASKNLPVKSLKELVEHAKANPGAQLRLGRHRQLAASGRRIFQPGDRREDDARALSQHRAVRPRPDRRHGAARLPVVSRTSPGRCSAKGAIPLAVAGDKRIPALPDTPTTTEAGLPEYKVNGWFALLAPGGTPKPILEKLNKELNAALNDPAGEAGLREGRRRDDGDAARTRRRNFTHDEIVKYRDIIAKAGIEKIE